MTPLRRNVVLVAAVVGLAAQITYPLLQMGQRQVPTLVVIAAVFVVASAATVFAPRDAAYLSTAIVVGWLAEYVGSATGLPFGDYSYTDKLTPQLFGVPAVVCLAWVALGLAGTVVARRIVVRYLLHMTPTRQDFVTVMLAAIAITGWDVFLDPQMVAEDYWRWANPSGFRGIPLSNYVGWLIVSSVIAVVTLPVVKRAHELTLWLLYSVMMGMSALGFALFFDDLIVATLGAMVTFPLIWLSRPRANRRECEQVST
jgi:uncharacterized membrane protein